MAECALPRCRMKVLLTGASGFIGSRLARLLHERGHSVVGVARHQPSTNRYGLEWLAMDMESALQSADWDKPLQGVDAVVNAAGVFVHDTTQRIDAVHRVAPCALFEACVTARVKRVVQVSALADNASADIAFIASKRAADAALLALPLDAVVVRPSLVFGLDGTSTRALLALAALPLVPLPKTTGVLQPVHIDDVVQVLLALVEAPPRALPQRCVLLVGPEPLTLEAYLRRLRFGLGLGRLIAVRVPRGWVELAARIGDRLPNRWLKSDALRLIDGGSSASPTAIGSLLGRPPRGPDVFIGGSERDAVRTLAQLGFLLGLLRIALAMVWIVSGMVSLGIYPLEGSLAMLAQVGIPPRWQPLLLFGAAVLDIVLGVLTLLCPARWLWRTQMLLILLYMAVIAHGLPEYWIHPFGPVVKNLPMLAILVMLDALERRRTRPWNI
jgi:uncharacterized protein YbjT (DUF2867 family)/uncharacterized membrane protein YphA (DoxX/SURF4 family)